MNTAETKAFVEKNNIVTLRADKTHPAPEVDQLMAQLGNQSGAIPFIAIFPASNPNKPILLDGVFTSPKPLIAALEQAGPSQVAGDTLPSKQRTAMRPEN